MYQETPFNLPRMEGLSEKQIDVHLKLYAGYVKNTNTLLEKLKELNADPEKNNIEISELRRRLPFEYNGMRMHEYYFEALGGAGEPTGEVTNLMKEQFGSSDACIDVFKRTGKTRGIGWTILSIDPRTGKLLITWVSDHELGQLADTQILLAMDMWEHAFMVDYLPSEKGNYIDAFFANTKWEKVNERLAAVSK